jgi:hypothetical protein
MIEFIVLVTPRAFLQKSELSAAIFRNVKLRTSQKGLIGKRMISEKAVLAKLVVIRRLYRKRN